MSPLDVLDGTIIDKFWLHDTASVIQSVRVVRA
jgi:hypothetical protein